MSAPTLLDLARGAFAAHARPTALGDRVGVEDRLRASLGAGLACWATFAAVLVAFAITTNDADFGFASHQHPVLAAAQLAIEVLAVLATLASAIGAAPLARQSLKQARREPTMRRLIAVPVLAVVVFAVAASLLALLSELVSDHGRSVTAPHDVGVVCCLIGLICGGIAVVGCGRVLFATRVSRGRLISSLACGGLVTMAMIAITLATVTYAIVLPIDAPQTASSLAGPLRALSVSVSVSIQLAVMLIATTLATITTYRGWYAIRAPDRSARPPS
jgi:F0F1-type ATP synthase membrane subunit c/vacuolar-type H+-ATPase subunit K